MVCLLLKSSFEQFIHRKNPGAELQFLLKNSKFLKNEDVSYVPDKKALFDLLAKYRLPEIAGEDFETLSLTVDEMIREKLFYYSYKDVDLKFSNKKIEEILKIKKCDNKKTAENYILEKSKFIQLQTHIDKLLFKLLQKKNYNSNILDIYHRNFGTDLLKLREIEFNIEVVCIQISLKQSHTDMSDSEIKEKIKSILERKQAEFEQQVNNIEACNRFVPETYIDHDSTSNARDVEIEYQKAILTAIHELSFILHPDMFANDASKLSENQKEEIHSLWIEFLEAKKTTRYRPGCIGFAYCDLGSLLNIKARALKIFESAGVEIKNDIFQGKDIAEQLQYLITANKSLVYRADELSKEIEAAESDEMVKVVLRILDSKNSREMHHRELSAKIEKATIVYNEKHKLYESLFSC